MTLLAGALPAVARERLLSETCSISIDVRCPEGVVGCKDVRYTGLHRKTGRTLTLSGEEPHTLCAHKVTPRRFLGHVFRHGMHRYFTRRPERSRLGRAASYCCRKQKHGNSGMANRYSATVRQSPNPNSEGSRMSLRLSQSALVAMLVLACPAVTVAQEKEQIISYKYKTSSGRANDVEAVLRLPEGKGNMRAVVILHDGGGWSAGRTKQYADLLTQHGFVTLEPRIYRSPGGWDGYNDLSKVFGALRELAKRTDVNPSSIYVMGQSAGAMLSILAATDWANRELNDSGTKFKAHASFYPVCWIFADSAKGNPTRTFREFPKDSFQTWSGAPIRIFIGTRDDYDDRDSNTCASFVSLVTNETQRKVFSIVKYENATHGWDHGNTYSFHTSSGCKGRGCINTNESSPEITRKGYQDLLDFLNAN